MLRPRFLILILIALAFCAVLYGCGSDSVLSPPSTPQSTPQPQAASDRPMAVLADAQGVVELYQAGLWEAVSVGTELKQSDKIRTGDDSSALITFFEGSSIELESATEITLSELAVNAATGTTTIKMGQSIGSTVSRVKKLVDSESTYEIQTPSATAMVRGSVGKVIVLNNGITIVLNQEGEWLAYAQGQTVAIPAGWQVTITPGSPPGQIIEQNPPPQNIPPPNGNQSGGDPQPVPSFMADFSASVTSGATALSVQFTNKSSGKVTTWTWDFGDGGTSTDTNPLHIYMTPGIYTVSLTVSGPEGTDTMTRTNYILVLDNLPSLDFSADLPEGGIPLPVEFTTESEGAISDWSWDFGDGGTSYEENPVHVYTVPGVYTVSLTVMYVSGTQTVTKYDYINVWNAWTQTSGADFSSGSHQNTMVYPDDMGIINPPVFAGPTGSPATPVTASEENDGMVLLDINPLAVEPQWIPDTSFDEMWAPIYGTTYQAQTLTPGASGVPAQFVVRLRTVGNPGDLVLELRQCDITGAPASTVLSSCTLPAILFGDNIDDNYDVYFPPTLIMEEGTTYALVLHQMANAGDAQNYYEWEFDIFYNYNGGRGWSSDNGSTSWEAIQVEGFVDFYFSYFLTQYFPWGIYESDSYDCGAEAMFRYLDWDVVVPAATELKFQIATNNDNETWNFIGPDGTNDTYYENSGTPVWAGHNGDRYVKYMAYLDLAGGVITPQIRSVTLLYR